MPNKGVPVNLDREGRKEHIDFHKKIEVDATQLKSAGEFAQEQGDRAKEYSDNIETVMQDGPVQTVNGKTGQVTGLAEQKDLDELEQETQDSLNSVSSQLAETDQQRFYESMVNRKGKKRGTITIVDDDNGIGFYTRLFELAKEYNIPITSAMVTNYAMVFPGDNRPKRSGVYDYNQVIEMKESGLIEFIAQTHNHLDPDNLTEEQIYDEYKNARDFLKKWGLNFRIGTFPFGKYDDDILQIASQVYDYTLGTGNLRTIVETPFDNYEIPCQTFGYTSSNNVDVGEIKTRIDTAVERDAWLILRTHIDQVDYTDRDFRDVIEYALQQGLEFVTVEEGIRIHGNIAQLDRENGIDAQGNPFGFKLATTEYLGLNAVHSNDVPSDKHLFRKRTHSNINSYGNVELGFPSTGLLTTNAFTNDGFAFQTIDKYHNDEVLKRWWNDGSKKWDDWFVDSQGLIYLGINQVTITDKPNDPKLYGKVTKTFINSSGNADFPMKKSGWLTSIAFINDDSAFQKYTLYQGSGELIRWWNGSSWGDWEALGVIRLGLNEISSTKLASEFVKGITIGHVDSYGNVGFPASGVITNYNVTGDNGYSYQEMKIYNSFDKYIRHEKIDGTWTEFRKFALESV